MRRCFAILGVILAAGVLVAGVPNRIIYQGRLFKSGVGISGEKSIRLTLVKADGKTVVDTKSFSVSLPATGEFTIVWDLEKEIDWRGDQPELKVEVDTDELTPRQQFSASPYAFVAKRVEVGAVDTLSIADGAVTSAKISAGGIEAEKINLANGKTLNSWVAPNGKIMADGIEGELKTTANHATNHEKGGGDELLLDPSQVDGVLVAHSTYTQVIQPTANEPALAVKGNPRSGSDVLQIYDSAETPVKQVSFDKDGNMVSNRGISAVSAVVVGAMSADSVSATNSITAPSLITQSIQAPATGEALAVRGIPGTTKDVLQIYDSGSTPTQQVSIDKDGNMVSNRQVTAASLATVGPITGDSVKVKNGVSTLYDGATNDHSGSLSWNSLQMGNNGVNYVIAGRTQPGGELRFVVNNENDYKHPGSPDGTVALTINPDAKVGIGTISPSESLDVQGNAKIAGTIRGATYGFGGMYSHVPEHMSMSRVNPITGGYNCPAGFTPYLLLNTRDWDGYRASIYFCWK